MQRMRYENRLPFILIMLLAAGILFSCRSVPPRSSPVSVTATSLPPTVTLSRPTETAITPEPSATATPVQLTGCVTAHSLRVRGGPGTEYAMVGGLQEGDCITILGRDQGATWGKIVYNDLTGWVSLDYLALKGDIQAVAVITGDQAQEAAALSVPTQPAATQSVLATPTAAPGSFFISVPGSGASSTVNTFNFEYACNPVTLELPLSAAQAADYASRDKSFYYSGQLPGDWEEQYYEKFLEGEYDDRVIADTVGEVRRGLGIEESDNLVLALTSLVQHIEYDCDKLFSYENLDDHDYQTNYPLETLYNQQGVCGDFSILLGKMLQEAGYGAAFLLYDRANHMALGVRCPVESATYLHDGVGYCYLETTGPSRVGVKPEAINGVDFTEEPKIIPIHNGKSFRKMIDLREAMQSEANRYGDYILQLAGCEEISRYKAIRKQEFELYGYETELEHLSGKLDTVSGQYDETTAEYESMGCEGELPEEKYNECVKQYDEVDSLRTKYNDLVRKYNRLYDEYERHYQGYEEDFAAFQALMEESYQSCSTVSREELAPQESGGQDG